MGKILIYNNKTGIGAKMQPYFEAENMDLLVAESLEKLEDALQDSEICLMLLDIELNDKGWGAGIEMITNLRRFSRIPMIVISSQSAETAKIMALEAGADDYVLETCNPMELMARIHSQIRRYRQLTNLVPAAKVFRAGGLVVDDDLHAVSVDGRSVRLTPIEYNILKLLIKQKGEVLSNAQIYESIWNMKAYGADNTIAVHVRHIREKIEEDPRDPKHLKVVWGNGYKIV